MTTAPTFDIRKSVPRRNIERIVVLSAVSVGLMFVGYKVVPESFIWALSLEGFKSLTGWGFFGLILIGMGPFNLLKVALFALKARGTSGEWRFCLEDDRLLWQVPAHAHGAETGFQAPLSSIRQLEYRTLTSFDEMDEREYWIHFTDRASIQLQAYTGVSLSWLVSKIHDAGVPYKETTIER